VMVGSLDLAPSEGLEPAYELWIGRREHWLQPLPEAQQFEHDRIDGDQTDAQDSTADSETSSGSEPLRKSA